MQRTEEARGASENWETGRAEKRETGKIGRVGDWGKRLEARGLGREGCGGKIGRVGNEVATHYPLLATGYFPASTRSFSCGNRQTAESRLLIVENHQCPRHELGGNDADEGYHAELGFPSQFVPDTQEDNAGTCLGGLEEQLGEIEVLGENNPASAARMIEDDRIGGRGGSNRRPVLGLYFRFTQNLAPLGAEVHVDQKLQIATAS